MVEVFEEVDRAARRARFRRCMPMFRLDRIYARGLDVRRRPRALRLARRRACPTTPRSPPRSSCRPGARGSGVSAQGGRFTPGNRVALLRSGREYFPALISAIDGGDARGLARDATSSPTTRPGALVADALVRAAQRGVAVRVLVDGWGARHYLTPALEQRLHRRRRRPPDVPARDRAVALPLATACAGCTASSVTSTAASRSSAASTSSTT